MRIQLNTCVYIYIYVYIGKDPWSKYLICGVVCVHICLTNRRFRKCPQLWRHIFPRFDFANRLTCFQCSSPFYNSFPINASIELQICPRLPRFSPRTVEFPMFFERFLHVSPQCWGVAKAPAWDAAIPTTTRPSPRQTSAASSSWRPRREERWLRYGEMAYSWTIRMRRED